MKHCLHLLRYTVLPQRYWLLAAWVIGLGLCLHPILFWNAVKASPSLVGGLPDQTFPFSVTSPWHHYAFLVILAVVTVKLGSAVAVHPRDSFHDVRPLPFWHRLSAMLFAGFGVGVVIPLLLSVVSMVYLRRPMLEAGFENFPPEETRRWLLETTWLACRHRLTMLLACFLLGMTGLPFLTTLLAALVAFGSWQLFQLTGILAEQDAAGAICGLLLLLVVLRQSRNTQRPVLLAGGFTLALIGGNYLLTLVRKQQEHTQASTFLAANFDKPDTLETDYDYELKFVSLSPEKENPSMARYLEMHGPRGGFALHKLSGYIYEVAVQNPGEAGWTRQKQLTSSSLAMVPGTGNLHFRITNNGATPYLFSDDRLLLTTLLKLEIAHHVQPLANQGNYSKSPHYWMEDGFLVSSTTMKWMNSTRRPETSVSLGGLELRPTRNRYLFIEAGGKTYRHLATNRPLADFDASAKFKLYQMQAAERKVRFLVRGVTGTVPGIDPKTAPNKETRALGPNVEYPMALNPKTTAPTNLTELAEFVLTHDQVAIQPLVAGHFENLLRLLTNGVDAAKLTQVLTAEAKEEHKAAILAAFSKTPELLDVVIAKGWAADAKAAVIKQLSYLHDMSSFPRASVESLLLLEDVEVYALVGSKLPLDRERWPSQLPEAMFAPLLQRCVENALQVEMVGYLAEQGHRPALDILIKRVSKAAKALIRTEKLSPRISSAQWDLLKQGKAALAYQPQLKLYILAPSQQP